MSAQAIELPWQVDLAREWVAADVVAGFTPDAARWRAISTLAASSAPAEVLALAVRTLTDDARGTSIGGS